MKLYSYPRCGTCRKALAWLRSHGLSVEPIDITLQPPQLEELRLGLLQLGRRRLFNTSGQSYRELGSATVQAMDDQQALAALAADGKLVKRPFLLHRDRVLTGFNPEEWQQLLLG